MSILDRFTSIIKSSSGGIGKSVDVSDVQKAVYFTVNEASEAETVRPVGALWGNYPSDYFRIPNMPYGFSFFKDLYIHSDLLRTVIRSLVQETFRNGLMIVPKFRFKCRKCGMEYDEKPEDGVCEICGYDKFFEPQNYEKLVLKRWIEQPVNQNGEYLVDVLMNLDYDVNIFDNAWLVVRKKYYFDKNGEIVGAEPVEILRANPEKMFFIMSEDGKVGFDDKGDKVILTCPIHRDFVQKVPVEEYFEDPDSYRCPKCNKKLAKAVAVYTKFSKRYHYIDGEVLHIKKFTHGFGYGVSPILSVLLKVIILMRMDYYVFTAYQTQRPPKGILVIRGREEEVFRQWQFLMEQARNNPHMIWPIVLPLDEKTARANVVEWLDLSYKAQDIDFIAYRDEIYRRVGAVWGVMPIFQADTSTGTGLANQGLQLTVTNRAVELEQALFNDKVLRWLVKQLGVTDWLVQLKPHEEKDMKAQLEREMMRIDIAYRMKGLGYMPVYTEGADGIEFKYKPVSAEEQLAMVLEEYAKQKGLGKDWVQQIMQQIMGQEQGEGQVGIDTGEGVVGVVGEGGELIPASNVEPTYEGGRMEPPEGAPEGVFNRAETQNFEGMPEDMKRKERKDKGQKRDSSNKEGKDNRAEIYQQLKEEGVL